MFNLLELVGPLYLDTSPLVLINHYNYKNDKKNLALVNVDQRCPVPKCEATITDRVPHLVRNSTVGNLLNDPYCTSVEDKNSTEAIRM